MVPMRQRPGRGSRDRGAAAVEFALVVPILLLLVFGITDYGRFFFDSVSLRQGAREGARQAVVQSYGACTGTTGGKIACSAKAATDTTMGTPAVRIPVIPDVVISGVVTQVGGWKQGNQLLVCMQSQEHGTGFVPLPGGGANRGDGIIRTKVYMSIEQGTSTDYTYTADLTAADWTGWCP